jgi:hypothetical protein
MKQIAELLVQAKNKIADRSRWTTRYLARDKAGVPVCSNSPLATSWCAYGAVLLSSDAALETLACAALKEAAINLFGRLPIHVNDILGHEAVMQMYDHAIQQAQK